MTGTNKPKSCYDCTKSNDCTLFWQNSFSIKPKALNNCRLSGCEYDKIDTKEKD